MPARSFALGFLPLAWFCWPLIAYGAAPVAKTDLPTVPPGFEVELVAGPPLVEHPTMGGFDPQGRLYVCDGPGMNLPAKELLRELPNKIVRLEDTDGDGRFDRSTPYAEKMTFPMGAVWYRGSVYTASPPNIWKLTDADGDGVAERREVLVSEFGFTGNAADIHGCFLIPMGGSSGATAATATTSSTSTATRSARGSLPGSFPAGRMASRSNRSPAAAWITRSNARSRPKANRWARWPSSTSSRGGTMPWCIGYMAVPIPATNSPACRNSNAPATCSPRSAASARWRRRASNACCSDQFGSEFRDNIFLAQFNTHCVVRTQITREGATFRSHDEDFLTSASKDFHPTDRDRRCRRQPVGRRYRRLVPHRLPAIANRQA